MLITSSRMHYSNGLNKNKIMPLYFNTLALHYKLQSLIFRES